MGSEPSKFLKYADVTDKTFVVTGGNAGIGYITARELVRYGANVIICSRNKERGEEAVAKMLKEVEASEKKGKVEVMILNLCDHKSVRSFVTEYKSKGYPLHVLINNAGVMNVPNFERTVDGIESTLAANHMGHFLLTLLLIPVMKKSASRIVNLSSFVHTQGHINFDDLNTEKPYDKWKAYTQSKLANIIFTFELAKRVEKLGISVHAVNPGFVKTDLLKTSGSHIGFASHLVAKTPEQGAETSLYVATYPPLDKITAKYWSDCKEHEVKPECNDAEVAKKLWNVSLAMSGLTEDELLEELK